MIIVIEIKYLAFGWCILGLWGISQLYLTIKFFDALDCRMWGTAGFTIISQILNTLFWASIFTLGYNKFYFLQ